MKKIFTILLCLVVITDFAQNKVIFDLKSITKQSVEGEENDTTNLIIPKKTTVLTNPLSKIVEITKLNGTSIGVQFEILKSKLDGSDHLIVGMAMYKKDAGSQKWDLISRDNHWPATDLDGKPGFKGLLISVGGLRLFENGPEYNITYNIFVNREAINL